MKKIVSLIICLSLLLGIIPLSVTAESDTCVRLQDSTGNVGYAAGTDTINTKVKETGGVTLIFDVLVESSTAPASGQMSQISAFSGSSNNLAGYDFVNKQFFAGFDSTWVASEGDFTSYATRPFDLKCDTWYEMAIKFTGKNMAVYLDGSLMVWAETDGFSYNYIILYPQYCDALFDNVRVCSGDYNVSAGYGDMWGSETFTGITATTSSSVFNFAGEGYSMDTCGKVLESVYEQMPERNVAPSIDGTYLRYRESGGTSIVPAAIDYTPYKGFTYVEDIRFDTAMSGSNFAVRFGGGYIAGYDWTKESFLITKRMGYGFASSKSLIYASTPYTIEKGTVYEMAVKQDRDTVSIYLNGVLIAQATNSVFDAGYGSVEISHYKCGVSIDNVVVAYPDYNVREATGNTLGRLTFDESAEYICGTWNYKLGTEDFGYSVQKVSGAVNPSLTVSSVEATAATVSVPVSLKEGGSYNAFTLEISYDKALSVKTATVGTFDGTAVLSTLSANPLVLTYVGESVSEADLVSVIFETPESEGTYSVTATLYPYVDDVAMASVSGSGNITVPDPGLPMGSPANFRYEDGVFYWDEAEGAEGYELYYFYKGIENYYDEPYDCFYEMNFGAEFSKAGEYIFYIYVYDDSWEYVSRSYPLVMIKTDEGEIFAGISEYAEYFAKKLRDFAKENEYYPEEIREIERLIKEAETSMKSAADSAAVKSVYEGCIAAIDSVPTKEERTDFGFVIPDTAVGGAGETVFVPVSVTGVTDLSEIRFTLDYDATKMTYLAVDVADDADFSVEENGGVFTVTFDDILEGDTVIATIEFVLAEGLADGDEINLATDVSYAADFSCLEITLMGGNGTVSVRGHGTLPAPGDANCDGIVDASDVQLITRYIAGLDAQIDMTSSDYNEDGIVDSSDIMSLKRLLAGLSA